MNSILTSEAVIRVQKALNEFNENIKIQSFQTVDARSRERFTGKIEEPRPGLKKGCIAGSKNIPFQD